LKECRQKLEAENQKNPPVQSKADKPKGFRRVAIAESDSDEENHDKTNDATTATPKPAPAKAEVKAEPKSDSSKPVIEEVSSSEQTNWWQRKDNNYSAYDKPIDKPLEKVDDMTAIKKQIDELKI